MQKKVLIQEAMVLGKQGQEIAAIFREQIAACYLNCKIPPRLSILCQGDRNCTTMHYSISIPCLSINRKEVNSKKFSIARGIFEIRQSTTPGLKIQGLEGKPLSPDLGLADSSDVD